MSVVKTNLEGPGEVQEHQRRVNHLARPNKKCMPVSQDENDKSNHCQIHRWLRVQSNTVKVSRSVCDRWGHSFWRNTRVSQVDYFLYYGPNITAWFSVACQYIPLHSKPWMVVNMYRKRATPSRRMRNFTNTRLSCSYSSNRRFWSRKFLTPTESWTNGSFSLPTSSNTTGPRDFSMTRKALSAFAMEYSAISRNYSRRRPLTVPWIMRAQPKLWP